VIEEYFIRDGKFEIDGLGIEEVEAAHDTPFYLYSAGRIREKYAKFTGHFPGFDVFYSFKANPGLAICDTLRRLGSCADVSSLGEIQAALRVGFKPGDIAFVGPGKAEADLEFAIDNGIYAIAAESAHEIELIDEISKRLGKPANILLRINTNEKPISPEMMVGGPSKFGFDEETVVGKVRGLDLQSARLIGIHVYSASQVLDESFICDHLEYVRELAVRLSGEIGFELEAIDFGGGFGVPYLEGDAELDLSPISRAAEKVRSSLEESHPGCRLIFEVGRYLVAESGIFVTRALRVKSSRGTCYIITDGGMNHFSRPVFMGVKHGIGILNKMGQPASSRCNVGGPICTPIDFLGKDVMLPVPEPGDMIGVFGAGAYGYSMSILKFMSLGTPAELMADGGSIRVIRKAATAESFFPGQSL
jgi:diaminopimelate decarboxylase